MWHWTGRSIAWVSVQEATVVDPNSTPYVPDSAVSSFKFPRPYCGILRSSRLLITGLRITYFSQEKDRESLSHALTCTSHPLHQRTLRPLRASNIRALRIESDSAPRYITPFSSSASAKRRFQRGKVHARTFFACLIGEGRKTENTGLEASAGRIPTVAV